MVGWEGVMERKGLGEGVMLIGGRWSCVLL